MRKEERLYRNSETSEKALERRLVKELNAIGLIAVKYYNPQSTGMPDRLILLEGGSVVWVELKSLGKQPTILQKVMHQKLQRMGHAVFVCSSQDEVDEVVEYCRNRFRK